MSLMTYLAIWYITRINVEVVVVVACCVVCGSMALQYSIRVDLV